MDPANMEENNGFLQWNCFIPSLSNFPFGHSNPRRVESSNGTDSVTSVTNPPLNDGAAVDDFLSGEVRRLAIGSGSNVKLTTPSAVSQFSQNMVAKDLYGISWQEREQAQNEIHGVIDQIDETPTFVSGCLAKMEEHTQSKLPRFKSSYVNRYRVRPNSSSSSCSDVGSAVIPPSSHPYERAILQDTAYVQSDRFRLAFLRTERFNPEKAAERLFLYFEEKEYLFGAEYLARDIRLKDLDDDTISRVEGGFLQVFPARDVTGRIIFLAIGRLHRLDSKSDVEVLNQSRALWMFFSMVSEDEETQRKGYISLTWSLGGNHFPNRKLVLEYGRINRAFPIRMASHHACVGDPLVEATLNLAVLLLGQNVTVRHRCHRGSPMEVQYKLLTFGIPGHLCPMNPVTGELDLSYHKEFMRKRWIHESLLDSSLSSATAPLTGSMEGDSSAEGATATNTSTVITGDAHSSVSAGAIMARAVLPTSRLGLDRNGADSPVQIVAIPNELDICFGRGKGIMKYPGNQRFRKVIEERMERYDMAYTKGEKSDVIREMVVELSSTGSRFLKQDELGQVWTTVGFKESCSKVSHIFRNQKKRSTSTYGSGIMKGK